MEAMDKMQLINSGKACPYCEAATLYVNSAEVYGRDYGMIYLCRPCKAWVGVHKGTSTALGRLANNELREWKKRAHSFFDQLWQRKMSKGFSKKKARRAAYKWLANELEIDINICHIGMFDVDLCKKVVEICKKYYR